MTRPLTTDERLTVCLAAQALTGCHAGEGDAWRYALGSKLFALLYATFDHEIDPEADPEADPPTPVTPDLPMAPPSDTISPYQKLLSSLRDAADTVRFAATNLEERFPRAHHASGHEAVARRAIEEAETNLVLAQEQLILAAYYEVHLLWHPEPPDGTTASPDDGLTAMNAAIDALPLGHPHNPSGVTTVDGVETPPPRPVPPALREVREGEMPAIRISEGGYVWGPDR